MKLTLKLASGGVEKLTASEEFATADVPCPHCAVTPLRVQGTGKRVASHDTYAAEAVAMCCDRHVGEIRARVSTLFGLEEDERVAHYVTITGGKVY